MSQETGKISTQELLCSIVCVTAGSTLITRHVYGLIQHEAWIAVITGLVMSLPFIWMYIVLAQKYPGMSLFEINERVFGVGVGKLVSVLYLLFFFTITLFNLNDIGKFVTGYILPETPYPVVIGTFMVFCAYAVRKGVKTMTSYSALFTALVFGVVLFLTTLLFGKMKLDNFLPLFAQPLTKYLEGTHVVIALPVCEILVLFAIFPNLKNPKGVGKAFWGGLAFGGFLFLIIIIRDTAVLGPLVNFESLPSYSVIRSINIGNILTRLEVLYALILIMLLFYKITIFYYACVYGVSKLLNLEAYQFLVLIFGVLIVIFSLNVFQSGFEEDQFGSTGPAAYFATIFELILPTLTLIVAAIRSHFWKLGG